MFWQVWNRQTTEAFVPSPKKFWCKCVNMPNRILDVCINIRERFGHYSFGQVSPVSTLMILMETIYSVVQLLVELTVEEG
jgi:hypothetical protein